VRPPCIRDASGGLVTDAKRWSYVEEFDGEWGACRSHPPGELTVNAEDAVPYTVWKNGEKIGETRFELRPAPSRLAGVFHPTASGLSVLPAVTAMAPALIEFGRICRARGIMADENRPEAVDEGLEAFANTPEGKRVRTAASHVAELELRDPSGRTIIWESILISDLTAFAQLSAERRRDAESQLSKLPGDPIRFMISATVASGNEPVSHSAFQAAEPLEVC